VVLAVYLFVFVWLAIWLAPDNGGSYPDKDEQYNGGEYICPVEKIPHTDESDSY
jgi:hypothetical protein